MDNSQENDVLNFPIQKKDLDPLHGRELREQGRLTAIKLLNMVTTGQIKELPEEIKAHIRIVDKGCRQYGLLPLEGDF